MLIFRLFQPCLVKCCPMSLGPAHTPSPSPCASSPGFVTTCRFCCAMCLTTPCRRSKLLLRPFLRDGLLPGTQTMIETEFAAQEGHLGKIWWDKLRHQFPDLIAPVEDRHFKRKLVAWGVEKLNLEQRGPGASPAAGPRASPAAGPGASPAARVARTDDVQPPPTPPMTAPPPSVPSPTDAELHLLNLTPSKKPLLQRIKLEAHQRGQQEILDALAARDEAMHPQAFLLTSRGKRNLMVGLEPLPFEGDPGYIRHVEGSLGPRQQRAILGDPIVQLRMMDPVFYEAMTFNNAITPNPPLTAAGWQEDSHVSPVWWLMRLGRNVLSHYTDPRAKMEKLKALFEGKSKSDVQDEVQTRLCQAIPRFYPLIAEMLRIMYVQVPKDTMDMINLACRTQDMWPVLSTEFTRFVAQFERCAGVLTLVPPSPCTTPGSQPSSAHAHAASTTHVRAASSVSHPRAHSSSRPPPLLRTPPPAGGPMRVRRPGPRCNPY